MNLKYFNKIESILNAKVADKNFFYGNNQVRHPAQTI